MHERLRSDPAGTGISPGGSERRRARYRRAGQRTAATRARRVHAGRDPELVQELAQYWIIVSS